LAVRKPDAGDHVGTPHEAQVTKMNEQPALKLPLFGGRGESEKVEVVGVFEDLFGHVRIPRRQGTRKIGESLALPLVQAAGDLMGQDVPASSVLEGSAEIPFADGPILGPVE
jgi:hypothetical protein